MTDKRDGRDPLFEREAEAAEGTELQMDPSRGASLEKAREEAQGVEVFEDPDATLPAHTLMEGSPGHEALTDHAVGGNDDEEEFVDEDRR